MGNSVERFQNSQWQKLKEFSFSKKSVLELIEKGTVLDIGCGDGMLLEYLKDKGFDCFGIDISSEAIRIAKSRGVDCEQADITDKLRFEDSSFDNVILTDVLEHLFQPLEVLKESHRVSKENIFISVPNFSSLPARIQVLLGRVPENNTPRDGHVYWMNYKVIKDLIIKSGFKIDEVVVNTFWEKTPVVGFIMNKIKYIFPSFFALSFIIKAKKK